MIETLTNDIDRPPPKTTVARNLERSSDAIGNVIGRPAELQGLVGSGVEVLDIKPGDMV